MRSVLQQLLGGRRMKLTVIGYWGGYPGKNGASSAYLIEKDGFHLMLDFGSGALAKLQQYKKATDLDAIIISHYHADHIADIGVLQHALYVENLLQQTEKMVDIYAHGENEYEFAKFADDYTRGFHYRPDEVLKLGPFFIRFIKTNHSVPCYGMRITDGESTIVYTADSAYQEEWIKFSKDADLLLADTNFYAEQDGTEAGHMTSKEVGIIAAEANVKELILTHLPHFGDHQQLVKEAAREFFGKITLAEEGLTWQASEK